MSRSFNQRTPLPKEGKRSSKVERNQRLRPEPPKSKKPKTPRAPLWPRIRRIFFLVLALVVLGGIGWGSYKIIRIINAPQFLPFQTITVVVRGTHVSSQQIGDVVHQTLTGNFIHFDNVAIKQAILQEPWVKRVALRRIWPNELSVTVVERKAVAVWNQTNLLEPNGHPFQPDPKTFPLDLPKLSGPPAMAKRVLKQYEWFNKTIAPLKLTVTEVDLNARDAWHLQLSNGIDVILGNRFTDKRFTRLVTVYQQLTGNHSASIASIDMRYPDGIAVKWK